jgi:hypothetical protein
MDLPILSVAHDNIKRADMFMVHAITTGIASLQSIPGGSNASALCQSASPLYSIFQRILTLCDHIEIGQIKCNIGISEYNGMHVNADEGHEGAKSRNRGREDLNESKGPGHTR